MAGITDMSFRLICKEFGCGLLYTEMISAKGIYYKGDKTIDLAKIDERERPVAIQIFGSEPEIMSYAAIQLEQLGADIIDINMGCPTPKIVNNGDGSALMKNPKKAGQIIKAVASTVKIPVTVKIRKGWDNNSINAIDLAEIAEDNGAYALAIHGRTRDEYYSGKADWSIIKEVKNKIHIPVFGNGDIYNYEDAKNMMEETGCDAVLIGRAAQGNPWIFKSVIEYLNNNRIIPEPRMEEKINMIIRHMDSMIMHKGEYTGIKQMRKHIAWYLKGLPNSNEIKNKIFTMELEKTSLTREIKKVLLDYLQSNIKIDIS